MTYACSECGINWWKYQYDEFDACPKCGGGVRRSSEPGSLNAESEYSEALHARKLRDERKAKEVAFDAYYEAWQHEQRSNFEAEVLDELALLPVAEPRRDLAA